MTARMKRVGPLSSEANRSRPVASATAGSRTARCDPRWSSIAAALVDLRERHRHSVRIVDADCACGTLLIEAARCAHALGFTAVEGRGIDGAPTMVGRARAAAARLHDPAIGLTFELVDMAQALAQEADFPADIVLCHGRHGDSDQVGIAELLLAAGDLVIADPTPTASRGQAA